MPKVCHFLVRPVFRYSFTDVLALQSIYNQVIVKDHFNCK